MAGMAEEVPHADADMAARETVGAAQVELLAGGLNNVIVDLGSGNPARRARAQNTMRILFGGDKSSEHPFSDLPLSPEEAHSGLARVGAELPPEYTGLLREEFSILSDPTKSDRSNSVFAAMFPHPDEAAFETGEEQRMAAGLILLGLGVTARAREQGIEVLTLEELYADKHLELMITRLGDLGILPGSDTDPATNSQLARTVRDKLCAQAEKAIRRGWTMQAKLSHDLTATDAV